MWIWIKNQAQIEIEESCRDNVQRKNHDTPITNVKPKPKKATLKNHIEATYAESWYPCNQCEYKTTHDAKLKNHAETTHKESGYPCNQCDQKTHTQSKGTVFRVLVYSMMLSNISCCYAWSAFWISHFIFFFCLPFTWLLEFTLCVVLYSHWLQGYHESLYVVPKWFFNFTLCVVLYSHWLRVYHDSLRVASKWFFN